MTISRVAPVRSFRPRCRDSPWALAVSDTRFDTRFSRQRPVFLLGNSGTDARFPYESR